MKVNKEGRKEGAYDHTFQALCVQPVGLVSLQEAVMSSFGLDYVTGPPITDEKLEDYLGVWYRLIEQGHGKVLDITLQTDYGSFAYPRLSLYTLTFGEERRELTCEQAVRVAEWLENLRKEIGEVWNLV